MVWLTEATPPEGLRIYVIGDVHGCLDQLQEAHGNVARDLAENPAADWRLVHVGDYVDRGSDSRGVVDALIAARSRDERIVCLLGNHDEMMAMSLTGDWEWNEMWLRNGGIQTLDSYGMSRDEIERRISRGLGYEDIVPAEHQNFLLGLPRSLRLGDFFLCHAGIDPDLPLDAQDEEALVWIRHKFLNSSAEYEAVIIHGHTPVRTIDVRPNRLGIDTGAVFGGELTCVVLEGRTKARISEHGRAPLI